MNSQLELLAIQDQEAVQNTYFRYPKVIPHQTLYTDHLEVKTIDNKVDLYKIDEVILYIIARFYWAPAWLVEQWFSTYGMNNGYDRIEQWIRVGLVWAQASSTGVFLRPTYFLFEQMDVYLKKEIDENGKETKIWPNYVDIPFNLLNHTCAEMQIVFDAMIGNYKSELWYFISKLQCLPPFHPLHITVPNDIGVPIYTEAEYRGAFKSDRAITDAKQDKLIQSIRSGRKWTEEFADNSLFTLVTYDKDNNPYTQRPDLVIPSFRESDGLPKSIAIEMELTAKTGIRYDKIMQSYKNNLVYGYVLYLCGNNYIVEQVKKAYKEAGGLGSCKLYVAPWAAPAQRIQNYSMKEEQAYKKLISTTIQTTEKKNIEKGD